MDYFELFALPYSLQTNKDLVQKKYYELSRKYHPDHFSMQEDAAQLRALEMSTDINKAKLVLSDPHKRLEYILKENGTVVAEEKYSLDPLFLSDMMDMNEKLMDLQTGDDEDLKTSISGEVNAIEAELYEGVRSYFETERLELDEKDLALLKDYYYKRKYLERIKEGLK